MKEGIGDKVDAEVANTVSQSASSPASLLWSLNEG
jgi:hypothetical protein